ncbi:putative porin [bacterium]|nr:putative porin [bacterium]
MNQLRTIITSVFCLLFITSVWAADSGDRIEWLKQEIMRQNKEIEVLTVQVKELQSDDQIEYPASISPEKIAEVEEWQERIKMKGYFLMRHEYQDDTSLAGKTPRNRQLFKVVLTMDAKVNEHVDMIFQLLAAGAAPNSSLLVYDDYFDSKDIYLDLAYIDWYLGDMFGWEKSDLRLWGGKMPIPFYRPQNSQLVLDTDVHPEGGALRYAHQFECVYLFANLGAFWVNEDEINADSGLWGAQVGVRNKLFSDSVTVTSGIAYFDFSNTSGEKTFFSDTNSYGNSYRTIGGKKYYIEDYDLIDIFNEYAFDVKGFPITVAVHGVINAAAEDDNKGWAASAGVGKLKKPGDWKAYYEYRYLEKDAVIGVFTDSNFNNTGTNGKGHIMAVYYQLAKNTTVSSWLFINHKTLGHPDRVIRAYFDFAVAF